MPKNMTRQQVATRLETQLGKYDHKDGPILVFFKMWGGSGIQDLQTQFPVDTEFVDFISWFLYMHPKTIEINVVQVQKKKVDLDEVMPPKEAPTAPDIPYIGIGDVGTFKRVSKETEADDEEN